MDRKDLSELSAIFSGSLVNLLAEFRQFIEKEFKRTTVYPGDTTQIGSVLAALVNLRDSLSTNLDICFELIGGKDVSLLALYRVRSLLVKKCDLLKAIDPSNPKFLLAEEYLASSTDVAGLRRKFGIWERVRSSAPVDMLIKFVIDASSMDDLRPLLSGVEELDHALGALKAKLFSFCELARLDLQKWAKRPRLLLELRSAAESCLKNAHQLEPWLQAEHCEIG